jgi:hypothetical protein
MMGNSKRFFLYITGYFFGAAISIFLARTTLDYFVGTGISIVLTAIGLLVFNRLLDRWITEIDE